MRRGSCASARKSGSFAARTPTLVAASGVYANLAWLAAEQAHIEQRLQRRTPPAPFPGVVLYDVTSSYLEGRGMITHAHKEDLAAHGMR